MKNFGLMLLSLFLALVVWFVVSAPRRGKIRQRPVTATLSIVSLPRGWITAPGLPTR